jgi:hypothetical protein
VRSLLISLRHISKHLHLAFKDCITSDEVYDVLVTVFLDVAGHYDPHYTKKTEEVCNYIQEQPAGAVIRLDQFSSAVSFDPIGCVRVLVRHAYLQSVSGKDKKVQGYQRGPSWPPPTSFFESGPVGFTYFVTKWFRYLKVFILEQTAQIESKEGVLQLEHIPVSDTKFDIDGSSLMRTAIGSTSGESIGKLMYHCWIFMSRLMSLRDPRNRPRH